MSQDIITDQNNHQLELILVFYSLNMFIIRFSMASLLKQISILPHSSKSRLRSTEVANVANQDYCSMRDN